MGDKYVQEEFLGEESLGSKYMGEKYVRAAPNNNQDIPGTCPTSLIQFGICKKVDIRVEKHFSYSFMMFHSVERWW